ncbi:MAG TPA: AI-2E family transporter [Methylocella sp.]|nr:AI-2E family transporter [Methylocella sp.]
MTLDHHRGRRGAANSRSEPVATSSRQPVILVLVIIAIVLYVMRWVLLPFVVAAVLAYICTAIADWVAMRTRKPRLLLAIAVFLVLMGAIAGFGLYAVPTLFRELTYVVTNIHRLFEDLAKATIGDRTVSVFGEPRNSTQLAEFAAEGVRDWVEQTGRVASLATAAIASMFGIILTLVLTIYFLIGGAGIMRGLLWLSPPDTRPLVKEIWFRVDPVLRRYFLGVSAVIAYAAVAAYLGLGLVLGIPHPGALALLTGALEIVPIIGPGASAVIGGMVALRYATGMPSIIAYAVYAVALRLSIDQIFGPLVLGAAARLHPVLIIFCFMAGSIMFGIVGVFLAVPAALATKVTLATIRDERVALGRAPVDLKTGGSG